MTERICFDNNSKKNKQSKETTGDVRDCVFGFLLVDECERFCVYLNTFFVISKLYKWVIRILKN